MNSHCESKKDENERIALKSWQDVRPHWKGEGLVSLPEHWAVGNHTNFPCKLSFKTCLVRTSLRLASFGAGQLGLES